MVRNLIRLDLDADTLARIESVRPRTVPLDEWVSEAVNRRLAEEEADPVEFVDDCAI